MDTDRATWGLLFRERRAGLEESRAGWGVSVAAAQSQASLSALNRQGWMLVPPSRQRPDKLLLSEGQPSAPGSRYLWSHLVPSEAFPGPASVPSK